jgi:cellulose biosynthesis protein BcsQ
VIEQGDSITAGISAKSERSGFTGAAQANGAGSNADQTKVAQKIITVYNIKGGVGKSTIARELAYRLNGTLVDCDRRGVQDYMTLKVVNAKDETIPLDVEGEVVVYDFPGKDITDKHRSSVVIRSDLVIIPYTPTFYSLQSTADSYRQVWGLNKNVIMIANTLKEDKDLERTKGELEDFLNQHDNVGDVFVLPLHYTRGLQSAENKGRSIFQLSEESPINKLNYAKVCGQLNKIIDVVKGVINAAA